MRFARGERISLCEQVYMMYGEAMDLTSEQDRAHGTRTLHEKFGFSRHHPQLYAAHFEEMTLDAGARVLIVDLRMIGDSVHIGEMCAAMKARFPGVRITYLCLSGAGHVVGEIGAVDEVLDFSYREYIEEIRAHERAGSLLPMIATVLARVEAGHFDAAININPALLSMFFFYHLRGLTVYGWTFDEQNRAVFRGNLFMYLFAVNRRVHLAEQLIRFLPPTRPLRPDAPLFVPSDDERVPRGSVGIFPGARLATHRWPKEYWAQVVSTVCTVWQMPVVIFGGAKEYGLGEEIMRLADSESAINLCGKIPLSELGAAMARLSCIVSNDSGGKHVAVAGGVPSVEISGSGVPLDQCGPYGAWGAVLQAELDCLNCEDFVCEHCSCMSMVKPAAVLAALKALICARARSVQDAETILEAVSRDPAFADISVWFSGTRRCDESFAYRPIRLRYHPVRGPERLWWFAFDEFCTKKNVALGGGAHRSSLTVRNIAAYMRVFSPQDKAALLREATAIDAGLAAAQEVLADAETLRDAATELDALTVKEAKTMVTLASRLAEMLTAYGAKGDAGAVFVSSLAGDLAIVREAFSRVLRIAECGG
jgi:ADP-heptose:LPS heptosyltransferase